MAKPQHVPSVFDSIDFPPYVYREYPKMLNDVLDPRTGQPVVVQNEEEEMEYATAPAEGTETDAPVEVKTSRGRRGA